MPQSDPELLTTREVLTLLRYRSLEAAARHLRRSGLQPIIRGSALLWRRADVLALIERSVEADNKKEVQS